MERNYEQILFDYIHSYGPVLNDTIAIFDNNGPNAGGNQYYQVFLKGGFLFESYRDHSGYVFISVWAGVLNVNKPREAIAVLLMLGHDVYRK
jgi:hypothetical protein